MAVAAVGVAVGVERVVGEQQRITVLLGDENLGGGPWGPLRLEGAAQPCDVPLKRGGHRCGRRLAPEQVDDRVGRHRPAAVHRERGYTFEQFHAWLKQRGITLWGAAVDTLEKYSSVNGWSWRLVANAKAWLTPSYTYCSYCTPAAFRAAAQACCSCHDAQQARYHGHHACECHGALWIAGSEREDHGENESDK